MDIKDAICPKCGQLSNDGKICANCNSVHEYWVIVPERFFITVCPTCGAYKIGSHWEDYTHNPVEFSREQLIHQIQFNKNVNLPEIILSNFIEESSNRGTFIGSVKGTVNKKEKEEPFRSTVTFKKEQCDRCNRISGSYYEAIIQVRGTDRQLSPFESELVKNIAYETEKELHEAGNRLAFIASIDIDKEGMDIIVGSQNLAQQIIQSLKNRLGGRYTTHPKLVGERAGIPVYRITYSFRLPLLRRGDIIKIKKKFAEVLSPGSNEFRYTDLNDGSIRVGKSDDVESVVGNVNNAYVYIVVYEDGDILGLMDNEKGITKEFKIPRWRHFNIGEQVLVLDAENESIIVG